ncbi:hypothetical protein [Streptomyces phaeochromogenes]
MLRQRDLMKRIDNYLESRVTADSDAVVARIDKISRQLGLGSVTIEDLRHAALRADRRAQADQLARLR